MKVKRLENVCVLSDVCGQQFQFCLCFVLVSLVWTRLRRGPAATRLLGLWVQIPPGAWISVSCGCCALSVEGVCDRPIPPPEEAYWLWCGTVCDLKTWRIRQPGCCVRKKNTAEFQNTRIIVGIVRGMEVSRVANTYKIWPTVRKEYWKTNTDVKRLPEDCNRKTDCCA